MITRRAFLQSLGLAAGAAIIAPGFDFSEPMLDTPMPPIPIGYVLCHIGNRVPVGWVLCEGQRLYRSRFPALSALLDSQYGGDEETFNVPYLNRATTGMHHIMKAT